MCIPERKVLPARPTEEGDLEDATTDISPGRPVVCFAAKAYIAPGERLTRARAAILV